MKINIPKKFFYVTLVALFVMFVPLASFAQNFDAGPGLYGTNFVAQGKDGQSHTYTIIYNDKNNTPTNFDDDVVYSFAQDGKRIAVPANTLKNGSSDAAFINQYTNNGYDGYVRTNKANVNIPAREAIYGQAERAALAEANKNAPPIGPCMTWAPFGINLANCAAIVANSVILPVASFFLWVAGWFFNFTVDYSLNIGKFLDDVPIVDIGWKVARDVANIFFIFVLLYIAINTILQTNGVNAKKAIAQVIIVALLLNFSLVLSKVVIDASNILALQFYQKMGGQETSFPSTAFDEVKNASGTKGISQTLLKGLGLESVYSDGANASEGQPPKTMNVLAVSLGGSALIMVTAFVLIAGAIMFVIRTIVLVFLMILAPLAMVSTIFPKANYWQTWFSTLINQSFFAPVYLMFMYLVIAVVSGKFGGGIAGRGFPEGVSLGSFLTGNGSSAGTLLVYVILIGCMLGALVVAKKLGAYGGDFAKDTAGRFTFGAAGWLGRQTIGRRFAAMSKTDSMDANRNANGVSWKDAQGNILHFAGSNLFAASRRKYASVVDNRAAGTYDLRNSNAGKAIAGNKFIGGLGTVDGVGGAKKLIDDEKKRATETQRINNSVAKEKALEKALKNPDDTATLQKALYDFSDAEFGGLGGSILKDPHVIQNARPSQIAFITGDKYEKLGVEDKNAIHEKRLENLNNANKEISVDVTTRQINDSESQKATKQFKALSSDARSKLESKHGVAVNVIRAMENNRPADVKNELNALAASNPDAHKAFLAGLKRSSVKGELGKLGTDEKAFALDTYLKNPTNNEEIIRNLSGDDIKAYEGRKDIPPAEKEKLKEARLDLLVKDLKNGTASKDDAKELMKGLGAGDLNKLIAKKDENGEPLFYDKSGTVRFGPLPQGRTRVSDNFTSLLTESQLKSLQEEGLDPEIRKAIGAQIFSDQSARGYAYVKGKGVSGGWR